MVRRSWGGVRVGTLEILAVSALSAAWVLIVRAGPLSLPYFWDESDVYVPGALWLAEHGFDPTPGTFPDEWSRGHPPLLFLIAALCFRLLGPHPPSGHLVVLPFAILALVGTYVLGSSLFGRRAGLAASLALATTPLFLSMGGMLLPEVPLTALTVLVLLFLERGSLAGVAIAGSALVLFKETGVFTAIAVTASIAWDAGRDGSMRSPGTWYRLGASLVPLAVLCAFLTWQKIAAGYFIFPHHGNLLLERPFGPSNLLTVWPSLVAWHGRWLVSAGALLSLALLARRPGAVASTLQDRKGLETAWRPRPSAVAAAMILLALLNAAFFSKMFWLERYALPAHPGILILATGVLLGGISDRWLPAGRAWLAVRVLPVAAALVLGLLGTRAPTRPDEAELTFAYADVIETHEQAFRAIEDLGPGDPTVLSSWPMTVELERPYLGYVERPLRAIHIDWMGKPAPWVDVVLLARGSRHAGPLREFAESRGMTLKRTFRVGHAQPMELWAP